VPCPPGLTPGRAQPFQFQIGMGKVIKAWDEGVMSMSLGEVAVITATPDYAYGAGGFPAWGIMPNATLAFEIEVLSIS
jgi:peptidylprolyl isomerase